MAPGGQIDVAIDHRQVDFARPVDGDPGVPGFAAWA